MNSTTGLRYEQIAGALQEAMASGVLRPGDRAPSVRSLQHQHRVSASTAISALMLLENQGWLEARPRSGFYVRPRRADEVPEPEAPRMSGSATPIGLSGASARIFTDSARDDVVHLGAAIPAPALLPWEKLNRLSATEARRLGPRAIAYDMAPGTDRLRRAIARRYLHAGCPMAADDLVVTTGGQEAVTLALRAVCKAGDVVAIESPMFFGILQVMDVLGLNVVEIPCHARTGMDLQALERAIRRHRIAACVAIPQFNNPQGSLMPEEHKKALVAMLGKRDIPLIEDDIYGELYFGPTRPRPALTFDNKGLVLMCASVSKTLAMGLRTGWIAPGRYRDAVLRVKRSTSVASATLPAHVVAEFLTNGGYDHHLRSLRTALQRQVSRLSEAVAQTFPKGVRITRPQGGLVLWVELPRGVDAVRLHEEASAERISIAPGPLFSARGNFRNFIRLNCGEPWSPQHERALTILGHLAQKQSRKTSR
jgi:DNA-binding transcriptional MocR family regulator